MKNEPQMPSPELVKHLAGFLTERRLKLIDGILEQRTRHITVVLEDIFHPQNSGAVIRTAECLGIQNICVIENHKPFHPNADVVRGATKWITLERFDVPDAANTQRCIDSLRARDFAIAATSPAVGHATPLEDMPLNRKLALFFGCEETGISKTVAEQADYHISLPMYGFTESFNISVCVAMALQKLGDRLRAADLPWQLGEQEKKLLRFQWICNSIKQPDKIIARYMKTAPPES